MLPSDLFKTREGGLHRAELTGFDSQSLEDRKVETVEFLTLEGVDMGAVAPAATGHDKRQVLVVVPGAVAHAGAQHGDG